MSIPTNLIEVTLGCLLHDIGKPVQRSTKGYRGKHSSIGRVFLKKIWLGDARNPGDIDDTSEEAINANDKNILDAISYHHAPALRARTEASNIPLNAAAYITYIADNIASGVDRRKHESTNEDNETLWGYNKETPVESVFNYFGSSEAQHRVLRPAMLDDREPINIPTNETKVFGTNVYDEIVSKLEDTLQSLDRSEAFIASLLNVLEATLSFVPSSTSVSEVADISLYDHLKLTAGFGSCIWHYLNVHKIEDCNAELFTPQTATEQFYKKQAFRLATFDISGIQDFIYTIHTSRAAKMLRSRSFYLEMLTEHLADELLEKLQLTRANLNYSGGGHAYFLIPNTDDAIATLKAFEEEVNKWFLENFTTKLYMATASVAFSANDVMRKENEDSSEELRRAQHYSSLYHTMSEELSAKKLHRYTATAIASLNNMSETDSSLSGERECRVCHTLTDELSDDMCSICNALTSVSGNILSREHPYVIVSPGNKGLVLPFGKILSVAPHRSAVELVSSQADKSRVYAKNKFMTGDLQGTRLWVGDYYAQKEFSDYVDASIGIDRLGVLRLDVDNLGSAFTNGFIAQKDGAYNTISRTATFSRMISIFFRQHINYLLKSPTYRPITNSNSNNESAKPREATIIYSGGDDLFVVGAWDDVLEFALELEHVFAEYTSQKLTVSAGLGIFPDKYPIAVMANDVGDLEDAAKSMPNKNSITLFEKGFTFTWDELRNSVINEKYSLIHNFFTGNEERGKSFIYKLLTLLDERSEPITHARWVYFITRVRNLHKSNDKEFQNFANKLHVWFRS